MDYVTRYQVTEDFQRSFARQYYLKVRSRLPRILVLVVMAAALCYLAGAGLTGSGMVLGALIGFVILVLIAGYRQAVEYAVSALKLLSHPEVTIRLSDSGIEYESSTGTRRYRWGQITEIKETKDYVCLMAGKINLLGLPKACFNPEALAFLKNRGGVPADS